MSTPLFTYDLAIINTVSMLGQVSTEQLNRLLFSHTSPASDGRQCRAVLKRLYDRGLISRLTRSIGGAGSEGYTWIPANSDRDPLRVDPHQLDVSELYVRLAEAERLGRCHIHGEFEIEDFIMGTRTKFDARVLVETDRQRDWMIELDRGTERKPQLRAKFRVYANAYKHAQARGRKGFPAVLYVVSFDPRGRIKDRVTTLREVATQQNIPGLFTVCTLDEAVDLMVGETNDMRDMGSALHRVERGDD